MTGANPYWDEVLAWAQTNPVGQLVLGHDRYQRLGLPYPRYDTFEQHPFIAAMELRERLVRRHAWTITDPDTVAFVAEHAGTSVLDPMAGTGYWARLLTDLGVDVAASDLQPPPADDLYYPVVTGDAVDAVRLHGDRTLLLAWPPCGDPIGADVLENYTGDRVVFLGEVDGNCGDDRMRHLLATEWRQVAEHEPPQWLGQHELVVVYDWRDTS